jgi:hypothetical protein
MREQEMRMRVFQFLKVRMRNMLMPATLGIGLAVGGCSQSTALKDSPDSANDTSATDTAMPVPIYMVVSPDANFLVSDGPGPNPEKTDAIADLANGGLPEASPVYGIRDAIGLPDSVSQPDQAVALDGAALDAGKPDGGPETSIVKYMAPILDGGRDAGVEAGRDASPDLGSIAPVYIAPVYIAQTPPDAKPAVRYLAQMPDSSAVSPLYMAPQPS